MVRRLEFTKKIKVEIFKRAGGPDKWDGAQCLQK
jgi:hypothetical protein